MSSLIRCAAALVLAGVLSGVCLAQDQGPDRGQPDQTPQSDQSGGGRPGGHHGGVVRAACQADIAKLCSAEADGRGAFRCLRDHQDGLSDACKSAIATARAERQAHGGWSHRPGGPEGAPEGAPPSGDAGSSGDMGPSNDAQPQP
jgi:hypothetical protein